MIRNDKRLGAPLTQAFVIKSPGRLPHRKGINACPPKNGLTNINLISLDKRLQILGSSDKIQSADAWVPPSPRRLHLKRAFRNSFISCAPFVLPPPLTAESSICSFSYTLAWLRARFYLIQHALIFTGVGRVESQDCRDHLGHASPVSDFHQHIPGGIQLFDSVLGPSGLTIQIS
jgi:hypothetical protein